MTTAVTGGAGHLGGHLVRALLARGDEVRALVHEDTRALDGLALERVDGSVLDAEAVGHLVAGAELVFHLAAIISTEAREDPRLFETNVRGPRIVAEAALAAGARRVVHVSSVHALSDFPLDEPMDEARAPSDGPRFLPYNRSKAAGEREVQAVIAQGLDAVIVNPTGVIGPLDYRMSRMGEVLRDLALGRMPGLVDGGYDFVDVRDVIAATLAAAERGRCGERYLLPGHWTHLADLAAMVEAAGGARAPRFTSPMWLARFGAPFATGWARLTGKRPKYTSASLEILRGNRRVLGDKAGRELGHAPRPAAESVGDILAWMGEAGHLDEATAARVQVRAGA
jgi:dihydroflavonol-4-reductase